MRKTMTAAAVVAAFGVCAAASAQRTTTMDLYPYGITLRGGVAIPVNKALTNVSSALANIGAEYDLRQPLLRNGDTYVSVDYFFRGFGSSNGASGSVLNLMLNQRVYTSVADFRSYYFFGVGAAFIDVMGRGTAVAARIGVGRELGPRTIAEIAGYISDRAGGARSTAITFNLGYRF